MRRGARVFGSVVLLASSAMGPGPGVTPVLPAWGGVDAGSRAVRPDTLHADARVDSGVAAARRDTLERAALGRYLGSLADSTDRRFGAIAAPLDTSGFAGLLASANWDSLEHAQRRAHLVYAPWWRFDRTTGHVLGGRVEFGPAHRSTRLGGSLGYAFASREWYGDGSVRQATPRRVGLAHWEFTGSAGREIGALDPDRVPSLLTALWAASEGGDGHSYLRRDGARVALERAGPTLRLRIGARSEHESPRATVTTWDLAGAPLELVPNVPARAARVRELNALGTWRLPWSAWWVEGEVRRSGHVLGGDIAYTRFRAALAGKLGVGRWATLVPQAMLGRLEGDLAPQEAFWIGGSSSLRSIPTDSETGQRKAFGRLELFGAPDLLELVRIPHSPLFDLFGAAQVASGVLWGADPLGGPTRGDAAWPDAGAWRSEAGFSLMYRPGIPSPDGFVRFDYAHGIGIDPHRSRWSMQFALPVDQIVPLPR